MANSCGLMAATMRTLIPASSRRGRTLTTLAVVMVPCTYTVPADGPSGEAGRST